jgi:hypothetical protein
MDCIKPFFIGIAPHNMDDDQFWLINIRLEVVIMLINLSLELVITFYKIDSLNHEMLSCFVIGTIPLIKCHVIDIISFIKYELLCY